jgi:hypothetical protein
MVIFKYGDPDNNPEDRKTIGDMSYQLDMVVSSNLSATRRAEQLYESGYYVRIEPRDAPPEEVLQHLHTRAFPEMRENAYLDGRMTPVWDVWVSTARRKLKLRTRRNKKPTKPKSKRITKKCKCK